MSVILLFGTLSSSALAAGVKYDDPGLLPEGDPARYEPYPIAQNATRYTPWFTMYHMQLAEHKERGLRGGEGGQMVMSFAISPVNSNLMLMGSDMAGIWRSIDGGENWASMTDNVNMRACMCLAFHPTKENIAFSVQSVKGVGSSEQNKLNATVIDGLYRSTDGGISWEQVLSKNILSSAASQTLIQFDQNNNVYVLTSEGVYKSEDDGETWEELGTIEEEQGGVYSLYVSKDGRTLIAATEKSGISISTSGGVLWKQCNGGLSAGALSLAVDPVDESHWYGIFPGETERLFQSYDRGTTWTPMSYAAYADKNKPSVVRAFYLPDQEKVRLFLIYTEMSRPIRYSDDGGVSWREPSSDWEDTFTQSSGYYVEAMAVCESNPNLVLFSFGDVIYKSTDGGANFHWSCGGYSGNYSQAFLWDDQGRLLISFMDRGMARTDEAYAKGKYPTARRLMKTGTVQTTAIDPDDPNHMYLPNGGWTNQTLYESRDCGETWTAIEGVVSGPACNVLEYHKTNHKIIYTTSHTSYDGGVSWTPNIYSYGAVSPVNSDVIYGKSGKNVMKSTDCGRTWEAVAENLSEPQVIMGDISDQNTVWVGCYNGNVVKIKDKTVTRYGKENGLVPFGDATNSISSLGQNPKDAKHLLVGTTSSHGGTKTCGLYESYDGGETWRVVKGLSSARLVNDITFSPVSDEIFLGTCSQGTIIYDYKIYDRWVKGTLKVDKSDEILLPGDADRIRVMINGTTLSLTDAQQPYRTEGEVWFPLTVILQQGRYELNCDAEGRTLTARKEGIVIEARAGDGIFENGKKLGETSELRARNGLLFVSVSMLSRCMEFSAAWAEKLQRVEVTYREAAVVTFSPGDEAEDTAEKMVRVKPGDTIVPERELLRLGYTVMGWRDVNGAEYAVGRRFTVTESCTLTAIWQKNSTMRFYMQGLRKQHPSQAVVLTDIIDSVVSGYIVDADEPFSRVTDSIGGRIGGDRQYLCYKFDIGSMEYVSRAVLCLPYERAGATGIFSVYGAEGSWDARGFGSTGVLRGMRRSFDSSSGYPARASKLYRGSLAELTAGNTGRIIEVDVSGYLLDRIKAGADYAAFYVEVMDSEFGGDLDMLSLYSLNPENRDKRPFLKLTDMTEVSEISAPGAVRVQAVTETEGKAVSVLAFYRDGMLESIAAGESDGGLVREAGMDLMFLEGERVEVKCFLWKDFADVRPLMAAASIFGPAGGRDGEGSQ